MSAPVGGRVTAIVPARGGSKGVPGKNLAVVGGRPLVARAVDACIRSSAIDDVVVSTDDDEIAAVARAAGATVVDRPASLAGDEASSESAVLHAIDVLDDRARERGEPAIEIVVLVQCTSPFIEPASLAAAVRRVRDGDADCVFAATETYEFLWTLDPAGGATGVNHDDGTRPRRQDRPPQWRETGAFYVMRTEGFRTARHRFFGRIEVEPVATGAAIEIDTTADLELARALAAARLDPGDDRSRRRVLAVAESDSYTKWAAWTLGALPSTWATELVVLRSPTAPSDEQVDGALAGTPLAGHRPAREGLLALRRRLRRSRPDVLLLACTGPTIAALTVTLAPGRRRPLVVSGVPGIGLPVRERAVVNRLRTDVFVAHSRREQREYAAAFGRYRGAMHVVRSRLPFLHDHAGTARTHAIRPSSGRVVFAAQPSVPRSRDQRRELLLTLARLGPPAPIVKLRGRAGDATTHDEPWPYPVLWRELVDEGRVDADAVELVGGPVAPVLAAARCVVTISSTVALEAVAAGVPVLVIGDYGVSPELVNDVFEGSGLIGSLTRDAVDAAGAPDPAWCDDNYLHDATGDDWPACLDRLVCSPRGRLGRPPRRLVGAAVRRTLRLTITQGPGT